MSSVRICPQPGNLASRRRGILQEREAPDAQSIVRAQNEAAPVGTEGKRASPGVFRRKRREFRALLCLEELNAPATRGGSEPSPVRRHRSAQSSDRLRCPEIHLLPRRRVPHLDAELSSRIDPPSVRKCDGAFLPDRQEPAAVAAESHAQDAYVVRRQLLQLLPGVRLPKVQRSRLSHFCAEQLPIRTHREW